MTRASWFLLGAVAAAPSLFAVGERLDIAWPTLNQAFAQGRPLQDFIQPTESGETTSGLFGCVRTSGTQFHEAIDLKPISRDRRGEATDEVFAALPGVVRHISARAGASSYGRYVVLEHPDVQPAVYTLYAHLASIAPGLRVGERVERAQVLGVMGRSAGGYTIPKERAHLHFEIGLRLTDSFQSWYDSRKFGSRNEHSVWNGMNLVGIDPLDFFTMLRDGRVNGLRDYFAQLTPAVRLQVAASRTPDFIQRYPALGPKTYPLTEPAGWEVSIDGFGVPFAWKPLGASEVAGLKAGAARIVATDDRTLKECRCKALVTRVRGEPQPGRDLQTLLQLLFGIRS
jgi:peptidoglycan LD-endopeptidase LytH